MLLRVQAAVMLYVCCHLTVAVSVAAAASAIHQLAQRERIQKPMLYDPRDPTAIDSIQAQGAAAVALQVSASACLSQHHRPPQTPRRPAAGSARQHPSVRHRRLCLSARRR